MNMGIPGYCVSRVFSTSDPNAENCGKYFDVPPPVLPTRTAVDRKTDTAKLQKFV